MAAALSDYQKEVYVREVVRQAQHGSTAAWNLQALLERRVRGITVFAEAQAILTAAAQISKLCWADTSESWSAERIAFSVQRAKQVRAIVRPDVILQQRAVRNGVEHFDHRLDEEFWAHPSQGISDSNIGPKKGIGLDDQKWFRHLDPYSGDFSVLDASVNLPKLVAAIEESGHRADKWVMNLRGF